MEVQVRVTNPSGDIETVLSDFTFEHVGCTYSSMSWHRDVVNDTAIISCKCGLRIEFPQNEEASGVIIDVSICGEAATLPKQSYTASHAGNVRVVSAGAG